MIEKGSQPLRQINGGPDDGLWGELVGVALVDGQRIVTVALDDGRHVSFIETAQVAGEPFPRELGS
jgi:hypothetical protein